MSALELELGCVVALMTGVFVQISRLIPILRAASLEPARNGRRLERLLSHFRLPSPVEVNPPEGCPLGASSSSSRR